jgi:hypothetical protein
MTDMGIVVIDNSGNGTGCGWISERWLLQDADATGTWSYWGGGQGVFTVIGVPDGATATFQYAIDDALTAVAVGTNTTFINSTGGAQFVLPKCRIRVAVSGGGAGTSLNAHVAKF